MTEAQVQTFRDEYCVPRTAPSRGMGHVALVCKDMKKTLDFYVKKMGFSLVKIVELPGHGYHLFLDVGGGGCFAFFWFDGAPEAVPGISAPKNLFKPAAAHGAGHHYAFDLPTYDTLTDYRKVLLSRGVQASPIVHHSGSGRTKKYVKGETDFCSFYMFGPDNEQIEFCYLSADLNDPRKHVQCNPLLFEGPPPVNKSKL